MFTQSQRSEWAHTMKEFCDRNGSRKTRLLVVDARGTDERVRGRSLGGITLGEDEAGSPRVEIVLGSHPASNVAQWSTWFRTCGGFRAVSRRTAATRSRSKTSPG